MPDPVPFKPTHHAYLFEGKREVLEVLGNSLALGEGTTFKANPDVYVLESSTFGIDDAREVKERERRLPVAGKNYIFLFFESATVPAQNALLKVLEEPSTATHFFLVTPHAEALLPTLASRLEAVDMEHIAPRQSTSGSSALSREFLEADQATRLSIVGRMLKDASRGNVIELIDGLMRAMHDTGKTKEHGASLERLLEARTYALREGSSLKLILEFLALSLPRLSDTIRA